MSALESNALRRPLGAIALFAPTIFVSAWLLFLVQPLFAKMALPLLGGASNVWNTAMVFFQGALLLGYLYAHVLSRALPMRWQIVVHAGVLALAFAVLPLSIGASWQNPPAEAPAGWLLALFAACVGLPFFALAANAPLIQRWFARTDHADAKDPYFLYGASNLGSMLALLAYPLLIEPGLALRSQSWLWSGSYAVLAVMILACGLYASRRSTDGVAAPGPAEPSDTPIGWRTRAHWCALAFVPAGLMLSVTTTITTDLVAVPLLWIVPLSLYLLSFVFVFARRQVLKREWVLGAQAVLLFAAALAPFLASGGNTAIQLGIILAAFFATALAAHGELARRRPPATQLTEFYLWMSVGGVLGGAFTALAAPVLFDRVLEYPFLLIAAVLLRPWGESAKEGRITAAMNRLAAPRLLDVGLPGLAMIAILAASPEIPDISAGQKALLFVALVAVGVPLVTGLHRPPRLALGVVAVILLGSEARHWVGQQQEVFAGRSFFGVYRVTETGDGRYRLLHHGTTLHGVQNTDPKATRATHTYYHPESGIGRVFGRIARAGLPVARIGAIGLGAGEIACYRRPGQHWTFFEIDPMVVRIARDAKLFRYLSACAPNVRIVVGDGRLTIARERKGAFDLLVVDAFSSDAIPLHLLTREAFGVYLDKLSAAGVLLIHVSNRYLDLEPVVAAIAKDRGLAARLLFYKPDAKTRKDYRTNSIWIALARSEAKLARYLDGPRRSTAQPRWRTLRARANMRLWTDDYSNVLSVLR